MRARGGGGGDPHMTTVVIPTNPHTPLLSFPSTPPSHPPPFLLASRRWAAFFGGGEARGSPSQGVEAHAYPRRALPNLHAVVLPSAVRRSKKTHHGRRRARHHNHRDRHGRWRQGKGAHSPAPRCLAPRHPVDGSGAGCNHRGGSGGEGVVASGLRPFDPPRGDACRRQPATPPPSRPPPRRFSPDRGVLMMCRRRTTKKLKEGGHHRRHHVRQRGASTPSVRGVATPARKRGGRDGGDGGVGGWCGRVTTVVIQRSPPSPSPRPAVARSGVRVTPSRRGESVRPGTLPTADPLCSSTPHSSQCRARV